MEKICYNQIAIIIERCILSAECHFFSGVLTIINPNYTIFCDLCFTRDINFTIADKIAS